MLLDHVPKRVLATHIYYIGNLYYITKLYDYTNQVLKHLGLDSPTHFWQPFDHCLRDDSYLWRLSMDRY